jgi:hypothetical protein
MTSDDEVVCTPANAVSFAFSDVNNPVVNTVNANTAATTTKAIRTIAVSSPVIPDCSFRNLEHKVLRLLTFI